MGASLCRLRVPIPFGGRAGFDMDASHVFCQGVLAAIILVGGEVGDGCARAGVGYEVGLPLCSVAITALLGVGSDPKSRSPEGQVQAGFVPF